LQGLAGLTPSSAATSKGTLHPAEIDQVTNLVNMEIIKRWKCFDADSGKDLAREIREYFIPDFSDWQNRETYDKALRRLIQDLKGNPNRGEDTKSAVDCR